MRVLRNLAVKEGHIHPFFKQLSNVIITNGRVFSDDSFLNEMRSDLGLAPISSISKEEVAILLQKYKEASVKEDKQER